MVTIFLISVYLLSALCMWIWFRIANSKAGLLYKGIHFSSSVKEKFLIIAPFVNTWAAILIWTSFSPYKE